MGSFSGSRSILIRGIFGKYSHSSALAKTTTKQPIPGLIGADEARQPISISVSKSIYRFTDYATNAAQQRQQHPRQRARFGVFSLGGKSSVGIQAREWKPTTR